MESTSVVQALTALAQASIAAAVACMVLLRLAMWLRGVLGRAQAVADEDEAVLAAA